MQLSSKADSDRILKLLGQLNIRKKIILAHHMKYIELMEKEVLGLFMVICKKSHTAEMTLGATCTPDTNPHLFFSPM